MVKASADYTRGHVDEVAGALGKDTKMEPAFFSDWLNEYTQVPMVVSADDVKAIQRLWELSKELGIIKEYPSAEFDDLEKTQSGSNAARETSSFANDQRRSRAPAGAARRQYLHAGGIGGVDRRRHRRARPPSCPARAMSRSGSGAFVIDPHMWVHAGASLMHVLAAVASSMLIGGCLALLAYYLPVFRLAVHGRVSPFLNSFSGTGWVLLAVLWFGLGDFTVVFSLAMVLIPFAIISVRHGLDSLDPELIEMAKSFGHSGFKRFRLIILPALTPFLFSTMRICFGVSWKAPLTASCSAATKSFGRPLQPRAPGLRHAARRDRHRHHRRRRLCQRPLSFRAGASAALGAL